jgi:NAD(P)-dependent dehydrogenase (short-subunit alcohol dehydrogenase family)
MAERTTLVTGASRGIGRAIAERLGAAGHTIVGIARHKPDYALRGTSYLVDLADADATAGVLREIVAKHAIDNLVNNAGLVTTARLDQLTRGDLDALIGVNVRAAVQCAQAVLPNMRAKRHGRIVNLGSRAMYGRVGRSGYGAAKAALVGMTRTWALEMARDGITVNCVAPGPIATDGFRAQNPPDSPATRALLDSVPVGRMGEPREIAATVEFLLSDDAGFMTGQVLNVCGGLSVGLAPM